MTATDAVIDRAALAALADERIDWRFKGLPTAAWGATVAEYLASGPRLSELGTPLLTLDAAAMAANQAAMNEYCAEAGALLSPHGKTTMAPALWARQLDAGAWGITLANTFQLRVGRAFGVRRLLLANELTDPAALRWVSSELDADPLFEFACWVDSAQGLALMDEVLREHGAQRPVDVLVELGGPHGRTGVRGIEAAIELARTVKATPRLRLIGVSGYEGALAHDSSTESLAAVEAFLNNLGVLHDRLLLDGVYGRDHDIYLSAGGSAYFDQVAGILDRRSSLDVKVLLRSGAYLVHDDGHYSGVSPFSRDLGRPLTAAMHGWARVLSRPEADLALLDGGKRDFPYDEGLPTPQRVRGGSDGFFRGASVSAFADQHAFLRLQPGTALEVGDVVRLGLSHPCTAFDKWTLIPVLDDASSPDPRVVDLVRTFF
jgi:D-serine deaminase-like pyridoxal phosphate-dependent protein